MSSVSISLCSLCWVYILLSLLLVSWRWRPRQRLIYRSALCGGWLICLCCLYMYRRVEWFLIFHVVLNCIRISIPKFHFLMFWGAKTNVLKCFISNYHWSKQGIFKFSPKKLKLKLKTCQKICRFVGIDLIQIYLIAAMCPMSKIAKKLYPKNI